MSLARLHASIAAVCPIEGVASDKSISFKDEATPEQRAEAQYVADAFDLGDPRPALWESIKANRDRRTQHGGYQVAGKWFHSDTFSRTQQLGLVMLGASIPPDTQWKTMDGSFVTMTPTLASQVFAAAAASDIEIFAAAEAHRTAMDAAADPAAYDFSSGWPAAFGEAL